MSYKYFIFKIIEKENVDSSFHNSFCIVKVKNISESMTNLLNVDQSNENYIDNLSKDYQLLSDDIYISCCNSSDMNKISHFDEYIESDIEKLIDQKIKHKVKYVYSFKFKFLHQYYFKDILNLVNKYSTSKSEYCCIFDEQFTNIIYRLYSVVCNNINNTLSFNDVINNKECQILYEYLDYYENYYQPNILEPIFNENKIYRVYDGNCIIPQKNNDLINYYFDDLNKKLQNLKETNFKEMNELKLYNDNMNNFRNKRGWKLLLMLKVINKNTNSDVIGILDKFIFYTFYTFNNDYTFNKIVYSDYELPDQEDNYIRNKGTLFVQKVYDMINSKYSNKLLKNHFQNYTIILDKKRIINSSYEAENKKTNMLLKYIINNNFENSFHFNYKLLPIKLKNSPITHDSLRLYVITNLQIYIKKDLLNRVLSGQQKISILLLIILMYHKNITNQTFLFNKKNVMYYVKKHHNDLKSYFKHAKDCKNKYISNFDYSLDVINYHTFLNMSKTLSNKQNKLSNLFKDIFTNSLFIKYELKDLNSILSVKPFSYQLNNMKWMYQIESMVLNKDDKIKFKCKKDIDFIKFELNNKKYICQLTSLNGDNNFFNLKDFNLDLKLFDQTSNSYSYYCHVDKLKLINASIELENHKNLEKYNYNYFPCGGIISDEVGLGKTFSSILLLLTNLKRDVSKKYRKSKITTYYGNNLIIAPNRLVSQWYYELKKYINPELFKIIGVIKVTSITDIKKSLYDIKVKKNNIYIISNNLVDNEKYLDYLENDTYETKKLFNYLVKNHKELLSVTKSIDFGTKEINDLKKLNLENINKILDEHKHDNNKKFNIFNKWNRIFVDECHECLVDNLPNNSLCNGLKNLLQINIHYFKKIQIKQQKKFNYFLKLKSNFKWLISATPFEKQLVNFNSYLSFLNSDQQGSENYDVRDSNKMLLYSLKSEQINSFIDIFVRKTTKKDIKGEVDIPIFTEEITYLKQNSVERNIYLESVRFNDRKRLLKLCTHIMVSSETVGSFDGNKILTIEEIKNVMVEKYKTSNIKFVKENKSIEQENKTYEQKYQIINNLIPKFDKFKFDDRSSTYFIEKQVQEGISLMSKNRYYSRRYWNYSSDSLNMNELALLYTDLGTINQYNNDFNLLEENINLIIKENKDLCKLESKLFLVKEFYRNFISNVDKKIELNNQKISKNKYEILRLLNQIKIFENNDFVKQTIKDPCNICFSDFENKLCITSCRHVLCDECITMIFKNRHSVNCPFCRTPLTKKDINYTTVNIINQKNENENDNENDNENEGDKVNTDEQKVKKYGTKLAYLLDYLGEIFKNPTNRVIIFSQYDEMLKLIGKVLDDFKIKNLFIKGNIMSVTKKIDLFKTDPSYRIIMLSSERSSSGSNLTEATHIIFADVIDGSSEMTKDIESQAIGRAVRIGQKKPVVVKRILMKDTIEEEIYNKNKYNMSDLHI